MHAGLSFLMPQLQKTIKLGAEAAASIGELPPSLEEARGRILANGMAVALNLGFGFLLRDAHLSREQSDKAKAFFEENFVILDPNASGGRRYYQGKFMVRTSHPGDDMNVLLRFCPHPEKLYIKTPFGETLNPLAVAETTVLSEAEAAKLEQDPAQVDLVVRFKNSSSIIGLLGRPDVDIVGLLLENQVQLTGHVGHLFKLGAIAADIQQTLNLPKAA